MLPFRGSPTAYFREHRRLPGLADPSDPAAWNPLLVRAIAMALKPAFRAYFRAEVRGAENLRDGPMLLVGVHGGSIVAPDLLLTGSAFYERFDFERPLYGLAHRLFFWIPGVSQFLAAIGGIEGSRENAVRVLRSGEAIMVFPGGEYDVARSFRRRREVDFHGRTGFVHVALEAGVPIVPFGTVGGQGTWIVLTEGERLARITQMHRLFGLHRLPLAIDLPWGLTLGYWPFLPFPAHLGVAFGKPIRLTPSARERNDPGYRAQVRDTVEAEVRQLTDSLVH